MRKHYIIILFFLSINIFPQTPEFGIRWELSYLSSNEYSNITPLNFYLNIRQKIIYDTNIKINLGLSFYAEEYGGLSYGLLFENEYYKKNKIIAGINFFQNGGVSHGTQVYTESYSKTFFHYVLGAGYKISPDTSIDLLFLIPIESEFGYSSEFTDAYDYRRLYKRLNIIVKLGLEFYF